MKATWMLLVVAVVWICFPNTSGAEVIAFADARLEAGIREQLCIPEPTPITGEDMLSLRLLAVGGVADLQGIQYARDLEYLVLGGEDLTSLSPISDLVNLQTLAITSSHIAEISPLSALLNLDGLFLTGNDITDIAPLSGLTHLSLLELSDNRIEDISPLSGLELNFLGLQRNKISDISPLAEWNGNVGSILDLRGNPLNDEAYTTYIPLLKERNPLLRILYDPIPEPAALALVCVGGMLLVRRRGRQRA